MAAADIESWDDDVDFQGDLFTHSVSTVHTNFSSRLSIRSDSTPADDDWHVMLAPNDDSSANNAIQSARLHAGIPIPNNVPPSALMNGKIQRLGSSRPQRHKPSTDDWAEDIEMPNNTPLSLKLPQTAAQDDWDTDLDMSTNAPMALKLPNRAPQEDWDNELDMADHVPLPLKTPQTQTVNDNDEERDDFDDFTDGSLGIRFAGTRREQRNRSSSASAMSPSLGSVMTESEDDDLRGLELPAGPIDLTKMLRRRQQVAETPASRPTSSHVEDDDDFASGLDLGTGTFFDTNKLTLHRNIQQKHSKPSSATRTPTTTLTFSEKPAATRIPRPVPAAKPQSRLEPVFEPGATMVTRHRLQPTTTSSQLLRNKRSMPVLRGPQHAAKAMPFLPAGTSVSKAHHSASKPPSHASAYHLRRQSDPHRSQSPPLRSYSRLSSSFAPDTPSRTGRAPAALAREAAAKRNVTKPSRRRNFGDGTELDLFDDLPTSTTKESRYLKQPSGRGAPKSVRNIPSRLEVSAPTKIPLPERMHTPAPVTPRSPLKVFQEPSNTPRYLRDTAASRIARETRLRAASLTRPKSEGPLMPVATNWKAQIASRSPHTSPSSLRTKAKRPQPNFIAPSTVNAGKPIIEKGMTFNPQTMRWEGNEHSLASFELGPPLPTPTPTSREAQETCYMTARPLAPSPPRPALITPLASDYSNQNIKVVGGMVFDPRRMCWLKLRPGEGGAKNASPSITEDEEDPFAAIEDLKEGPTPAPNGRVASVSGGLANDEWLVGEEFDLGPEFIRRQRDEEAMWRHRCEAWFPEDGSCRMSDESWRWDIRDIASQMF